MGGLFGSPIVQTTIGVITVWFLGSMLCSGLVELLASAFGFKANNLWQGLERSLSKEASAGQRVVAGQVKDLATRFTTSTEDAASVLRTFITKLPGVSVDTARHVPFINRTSAVAVLSTLDLAGTPLGGIVAEQKKTIGDDKAKLQEWFEGWFDQEMELLRIAYRRKIRWFTAAAAIAISLVGGLSSLTIARELYNEPAQRAIIVAQADQLVAAGDASLTCPTKDQKKGNSDKPDDAASDFTSKLNCVRDQAEGIDTLELSLWQQGRPSSFGGWLLALLGMAITAGALSAGAPFWFDLLKRLMGLQPKPVS